VNLTRRPADYRTPRWSADGKRIVFASDRGGDGLHIFTMDADGRNVQQLTSGATRDTGPAFTATGDIVFARGSFPNRSIYFMHADGSSLRNLTPGSFDNAGPAPAPAGPLLAFARYDGVHQRVFTLNMNSGQTKQVTTPSGADDDAQPNWSPSGNDIVFTRSGAVGNLFIVHKDGTGLRQLTNTPSRSDSQPAFSPDGTQIVFSACTDPNTPAQHCGLSTMDTAATSETDISTLKAPYVDTFTGDLLDPFWTTFADGSGFTMAQANGQLEFTLPPATAPGGPNNWVNIQAFMACRFPSDFDIQVDYKLLSGPLPPNIDLLFNTVEFTGGSFLGGTHGMFVFNPGFGDPGVSTNFPGANTFAPDTSLSGTMRMVRTVGAGTSTISAYRKVGTNWVLMRTSDPYTADEVAANLSVFTNTFPFPNTTVKVAYDNFRVNSGAITCPTWWTDNNPDWQPAT
jgi:dipeptidyl aminopeptidase/acylaminoacyl peptidase